MNSEFPLYDLVQEHHHEPITQMQAYLRDDGRSWDEIEARRKEDLRNRFSDLKEGVHPILVVLEALDNIIGPRHPMTHIVDLVEDQNSFRHMYMPQENRGNGRQDQKEKGGKPKKTEEEFQRERKEHIDKLIKREFCDYRFDSLERIIEFADKLNSRLDNPNERSLDVAKNFFGYFVQHRHFSWDSKLAIDHGLGAINHQLDQMIEDESFDKSVHRNDQYIEGDLLEMLAAYEPRTSYEESRTRDEYQTQEDIELRRSMEVVRILENWKNGAHPFHVITDVMDVAMRKYDLGLETMAQYAKAYQQDIVILKKEKIRATPEQLAGAEDNYARLLQDQKKLRRQARKVMHAMREEVIAYRGPDTHPEFAAQIDAFMKHLMQTDEPSLSIVQGVAEAVFEPVDDARYLEIAEPDWRELDENFDEDQPKEPIQVKETCSHDAPLLTRIRVGLRNKQKEEDAHFAKQQPMGKLVSKTEAQVNESLKETFARRAKTATETNPDHTSLLIKEMRIDATGSALIKPYPTDQYEDHFDEDLYGTTTARITTYSVSLIPQHSSQMQELAARVKKALEEIADTKCAFEIPFDMTARYEAYDRPARERKWKSDDPVRYSNTFVKVHDNCVQIETRLDLDDVWNLYYLLEDIIEPNEQIAYAMNAARYAEERGVLLKKEGINSDYSNQNLRPEEQMGSLDNVSAEDYVPATMEHTLKLYALGEIDEEQLLQRTLVLADHTLTGRMLDPVGLLPAFNRLTDRSEGNRDKGAVITYDDALRERTRDILQIMTGTYGEKDRPLYPALIRRVAEISKPLRDKLRDTALQEEMAFSNRMRQYTYESPRDWTNEWNDPLDDKGDINTKVNLANPELSEAERKNRANIARTANIALRSSDVGVTTDRTWRDTNYVSRSKNSLWVRVELPSALQPFIKKGQRPDMGTALKLIRG